MRIAQIYGGFTAKREMLIMSSFTGLTVYNLTPHNLNYIDEKKTHQTRSGERILQQGLTLREATLDFIPQGTFTLSVVEPPMTPTLIIGNLNIYNSANAGFFQEEPPVEYLNNADILVVSQKCANVINYRVINGSMLHIYADKFFIPRGLVYEYVGSNGYAKKGSKIVGCIGLQRAVPIWSIVFYAQQIQMNQSIKISLASLCSVCYEYSMLPYNQRVQYNHQYNQQYENALKVINDYLQAYSFRPYKTLEEIQKESAFGYAQHSFY